MNPIGVDCIFDDDGTVQVRRIKSDNNWETVEQGRQWRDDDGLHVLVMRRGMYVAEIMLSVDDLQWQLQERGPRHSAVA